MSREESAKSSTFLFCLLIFVFTCSEIQARKLDQICSPSSCGHIKNISYPFRLKGDPSRCGYPEFELSCESNQTILNAFSDYKYYVKRISYDKSTITVADFNLANGSCSLPYTSFPSHRILPDLGNFTYYYYHRTIYLVDSKTPLVYFVNCPRIHVNQAYSKVPCLSGNQSNVYVGYDSEIPELCSFISKVPVLDNRNVENPSYEAFRKLLQSGFDFRWSVECRGCYVDGTDCIFTAGRFEGCFHYNLWENFSDYIEGIVFNIISGPPYNSVVSLIECGLVYLIMVRFTLASILLVFLIHKYKTTLKRVDIIEKFLYNQQSWMPKRYSYHEIIVITNHFKDKLGQGGFGSVYKGQLHTGCFIAVKMLENSKFSVEEFINEVSVQIHNLYITLFSQ